MIFSRLYISESVVNTQRKFGSDIKYGKLWIKVGSTWKPAMLTADQIRTAMDRAVANPEDVKPRAGYFANLLHALLGR